MEKQLGSQDTSESMWPARSGGSCEEQAPLAAGDALRADSQPAHDVLDRGVPLSDFQWARASSDPAQWLRPYLAADADETKADASQEDLRIAVSGQNSTIRFAPSKLPEWFWSGSLAGAHERALAIMPEKKASEKTEAPSDVASRLRALRGAVSAQAMENLGRRKGLPAPHLEESTRRSIRVSEAGTGSPIEVLAGPSEEVQGQPADARAAIVAVPEEVIEAALQTVAPREFIPVMKHGVDDDWDEDEVQILPARRGQYKP